MDLFESGCDVLVDAVNCVGVSGKGLALAFKQRFPAYQAAYAQACHQNQVAPGKCFLYATNSRSGSGSGSGSRLPTDPKYIISVPTKRHWRDPSTMQDVKASVEDMVAQLNGLPLNEVRSVAIPALGCGLGGLPWSEVEPMMVTALKELHPNIVATIIPLAVAAAPQLKTGLQQSTKTRRMI